MTDLEKQLRGSIAIAALDKMRPVFEEMYGVVLDEYMSLDNAAAVSRNSAAYSSTRESADKLLDLLIRANDVLRIQPPAELSATSLQLVPRPL